MCILHCWLSTITVGIAKFCFLQEALSANSCHIACTENVWLRYMPSIYLQKQSQIKTFSEWRRCKQLVFFSWVVLWYVLELHIVMCKHCNVSCPTLLLIGDLSAPCVSLYNLPWNTLHSSDGTGTLHIEFGDESIDKQYKISNVLNVKLEKQILAANLFVERY